MLAFTMDEDDVYKDDGRRRGADFSQALASQMDAARECAKDEIRRFVKVLVEVETIGGRPLVFSMWASEDRAVPRKKAQSAFACDVCRKTFESAKKLLQHSRMHSDGEQDVYTCSVCGKIFDEQRKLALHFRYHKAAEK